MAGHLTSNTRNNARAVFMSVGLVVAGWGALAGCKANDEAPADQATCIAGQVSGCTCATGAQGMATCTSLGVPGMCVCAAAGAGGVSGAGTGGMSGVGGTSGGVGGAAGMGGASGAAGMMVSGGAGGLGGGGASGAAGMAGMTGGSGGVGGQAGTGTGGGGELPDGEYCAAAADWDPAWVEFEDEVLRLTNEARAVGHNCDAEGNFGPADPLTMSPILRCSARLHSKDMGENDYFAHDAQDGRDPFERMEDAGYVGRQMGENIAKGQQDPAEVVEGWLDSDGHCANIMNPGYTEIGVGFWEGEADNMFFNGNKLWTQNFGTPAGGDGSCPFPPQFCN